MAPEPMAERSSTSTSKRFRHGNHAATAPRQSMTQPRGSERFMMPELDLDGSARLSIALDEYSTKSSTTSCRLTSTAIGWRLLKQRQRKPQRAQ
jgi:hypothetical protein